MLRSIQTLPISEYCAATLVRFRSFRFIRLAGLSATGTVQRSWLVVHVMAGLHGDALRVVVLRVLEAKLAVVHYVFSRLLLAFVAVKLDLLFRPVVPIDHDRARIVGVLAGNGIAWIPPGQIRVLLLSWVEFYLWLLVLFYF